MSRRRGGGLRPDPSQRADRLGALGRRVVRCARCSRLVAYLETLREAHPGYWNRPVPGFGDPSPKVVIVGLAPGRHGANRSGRPFWMDASGEWLYGELERMGLWNDERLHGVRILNAVRCVPPGNRPLTAEVDRCSEWLRLELEALPRVRVVLALGGIAHRSVLRIFEMSPLSRFPFRHGARFPLPGGTILLSSYHPSRQNTQTGRLSRRMWSTVLRRAARLAETDPIPRVGAG